MSRGLKYFLWAVGLILLLFLLGMFWPLELLVYLAIGWGLFLNRVLPQVSFDWPTIGLSITALVLFAIGLHQLAQWFYRSSLLKSESGSTGFDDAQIPAFSWSPRWTFSIATLLIMMFVAGTAIVGIVHQATWIATSPEPLFQSGTREAAYRNQSLNHLKQISIGNQGFAAAKSTLLPGGTADSYGRRMHGWHALLLPFAEEQRLYEMIQFDKPWDHQSNSEAYQTDVVPYTNPWLARQDESRTDKRGYALTDYASNIHVVGPMPALREVDVSDGASKTLLFGEVTEERKPWGFPANWRDPARGINRDANGFGGPWSGKGAQFAMADGSARFISDDIDPEVLRAMSTPAGGEDIDDR